jgi:hypothetical protein
MTSVRINSPFIPGRTYPVWINNKCIEVDGSELNRTYRHTYTTAGGFNASTGWTEARLARIEASLEKAGLLLSWAQFDNL